MISASLSRAVVTRHETMVGSLRLAARIKVVKVTPLGAARAALFPRTGSVAPGAPPVRSFSGSPVFFVATKKKTTTAAKKTTARGKTAVTKKKTAKKPASAKKKTAVKKKAAPKKKKVAAKRTKRTLTPEQREARREKLAKSKRNARVKELKELALLKEEPRPGSTQAWTVFTTAKGPELRSRGVNQTDIFPQLATEFKSLPAAEMERLKTIGKTNHETYAQRLDAWLKSHTPTQISTANKARASLKRMGVKTRGPLRDSRVPKKSISPFIFFAIEKVRARAPGSPVPDCLKEAGAQWKTMSDTQKRPYEDMATQDKKRFDQESKVAYGI